jgi:Rieske Fe-S protein
MLGRVISSRHVRIRTRCASLAMWRCAVFLDSRRPHFRRRGQCRRRCTRSGPPGAGIPRLVERAHGGEGYCNLLAIALGPLPKPFEEDAMIRRRTFLQLIGCAAAPTACSAGAVPPANVGDVAAGNASALQVGTLEAVAGEPVCVGRDANGVYAMTLICTHQGCDMGHQGSVSARGLSCACHGSIFDTNGNVVGGPAPAALAHFAVTADASGNLTIHTGTEVGASSRLAIA